MLGDIVKSFFGNILAVFSWILIMAGIIGIFFSPVSGIVLIVIGILLISISTVLKRRVGRY